MNTLTNTLTTSKRKNLIIGFVLLALLFGTLGWKSRCSHGATGSGFYLKMKNVVREYNI